MSAFAFGGSPERALKKALAHGHAFVSLTLLQEYREVPLTLRAEEKIDENQFKALVMGIATFVSAASLVEPQRKLTLCRDPGDNMVLECCVASNADILITGDKDLLNLRNLPFALKILSPRQYLQEV